MKPEAHTLTIYRVEDPHSRRGLYRVSDYANDTLHDTESRHPMPSSDARLKGYWCGLDYLDQQFHFFGFTSLEQIKFWIHTTQARDRIDAEGLVVSVFEAIGYAGDTQAVYIRNSRSDTTETLRLTEI